MGRPRDDLSNSIKIRRARQLSVQRSEIIGRVRSLAQDADLQEYAEEIARCLESNCYRAAIILSWNILMTYLYLKIESYGLSNFARMAKRKQLQFKGRLNTIYDLNKFKDADIIELSHDIGIFDRNAKERLKQLAFIRNGCAHVTQLIVDEVVAYTFVSELLNYVILVKSSTIVKGTDFVVQSILTFTDEPTIRKHVRSVTTPRRLTSIIKSILDELQKANYAQLGIMENYFTYLQIVTDTTTTLEKKKRLYLVLHERYFLRGDYVAQSRLQPQILKLLQESGIRRMVMRKGLIEAFISLLSTSPSYDEAGQRSDIIALFGADLTKDQLNRVAECIVTNDQVHPSWKAQRGLKQVLNARVGELNPIILDKLKQVKWIT